MTRQPLQADPPASSRPDRAAHEEKQVRVLQLINAYRFRGHQVADIDPLGLRASAAPGRSWSLAYHDLSEADLDTVFDTGSLASNGPPPCVAILARLRATYCGSVGSEYMHITETAEKRWIQQRLERRRRAPAVP